MSSEDRVRKAFMDQSHWCLRLGSPFMERLMRLLVHALDQKTETGRRILDWPGNPDATADAVPLRLAGALHGLVRAGNLPELAAFYSPGSDFEDKALISAVMDAIRTHDAAILPWLDHAPQTNEVRRSAIVFAGLTHLASTTQLPVSLLELGASAGLNLQLGQFGYDFAGNHHGKAGSTVQLNPEWTGPIPERQEIMVQSRCGCDLNPLNVTDAADRNRLLAYLWPDQSERIARTKAAIDIALEDPPKVDKADAAVWLSEQLEKGRGGEMRVVYHTIAWQYFPQAVKDQISDTMQLHGSKATENNPLAWLSFEMSDDNIPELILQRWPHGNHLKLATASAHVDWVEWLAWN